MLENIVEKTREKTIRAIGRCLYPLQKKNFPIGFIWGAPHSGTYILYDLLSLSPDVACPRKYSYRRREGRGLYRKENINNPHLVMLDSLPIKKKCTPIEGYKHIWSAGDPATRYRQLLGEHLLCQRGVLVDKLPHYSGLFEKTRQKFPHARHIFLYRDPRCLVVSYYHTIQNLRSLGKEAYRKNNDGFWKFLPNGWEVFRDQSDYDKSLWIIISSLQKERMNEQTGTNMNIFYESLISDIHGSVKKTLQFLALEPYEFIPALPRKLHNFNEQRITEWQQFRKHCNPDLVKDVENLTRELGYEI